MKKEFISCISKKHGYDFEKLVELIKIAGVELEEE